MNFLNRLFGPHRSIKSMTTEIEQLFAPRRALRTSLLHRLSRLAVSWHNPGWRLKPQLQEHRGKMFILDYFGSDEPHANLGVPLTRHLTAFPVTAAHQRTFLGYRVDPT